MFESTDCLDEGRQEKTWKGIRLDKTPGKSQNYAAYVNNDGNINNNNGVRPALPLEPEMDSKENPSVPRKSNLIPSSLYEGKTHAGRKRDAKSFSLLGESPASSSHIDKVCSFESLLKAHRKARRGKQYENSTISFEMNLADNLTRLSNELNDGTYKIQGYYSFVIRDPKVRTIHALNYPDRVVQHSICDEVLEPVLDKRLIYDNASCRIGKGTHFALKRLTEFMSDYYKRNGECGYFLRCDISKFFDNIDHDLLKMRLGKIFGCDERFYSLLCSIIDSYEKGLPLGNQTSQWFAIFYLDTLDRLIKEKLKIKYYIRYMDDFVLIHSSKDYLKRCLKIIEDTLSVECKLSLNSKTQISPLKNGIDFLGFHFYLSNSGKVIRKVRTHTKKKYKRRLKKLKADVLEGKKTLSDFKCTVVSYNAHLSHGHTYKLQKKNLDRCIFLSSWL